MTKINLKSAREYAGYTQEAMGKKMGVTRQTIVNWEKGFSIIGTSQLYVFCLLTGFKTDDILIPNKSTKSKPTK